MIKLLIEFSGFVIDKKDDTKTNQLFICDNLTKTWIDRDTQLSLNDRNDSAVCVQKVYAHTMNSNQLLI